LIAGDKEMLAKDFTRIRVVDLETTGMDPSDHVIEIAAVDVVEDRVEIVGTTLVRPPCVIPPEASAIHHIVDDDVLEENHFDNCWPALLDLDGTAGVTGFVSHNWAFDSQWLAGKLNNRPSGCTYKAALRVWPDAPNHKNQTLRYWLKPNGLERQQAQLAHRALADAYVTAFLLRDLLRQVPFEQIIEWTAEPACLPTVPFGKHRGLPWSEVPDDYLNWILTKSDQTTDLKFCADRELKVRTTRAVEQYVDHCDKAIRLTEDVVGLEAWWRGEHATRGSLGLTQDHPMHHAIIEMCRRHKVSIQTLGRSTV
jgi:exodeoxyribonuclease X